MYNILYLYREYTDKSTGYEFILGKINTGYEFLGYDFSTHQICIRYSVDTNSYKNDIVKNYVYVFITINAALKVQMNYSISIKPKFYTL